MNFGQAIEAMEAGSKVARSGWNGKGLSVELQVPDENSKMTLPYIFMNYPATPAKPLRPAISMPRCRGWQARLTCLRRIGQSPSNDSAVTGSVW